MIGNPRCGQEHEVVRVREKIRRSRLPWNICALAGVLLLVPPGYFAVMKAVGAGEPGGRRTLLMVLALAGGALFILGAIGQWTIRCPQCRGLLKPNAEKTESRCRHCGVSFNAKV